MRRSSAPPSGELTPRNASYAGHTHVPLNNSTPVCLPGTRFNMINRWFNGCSRDFMHLVLPGLAHQ